MLTSLLLGVVHAGPAPTLSSWSARTLGFGEAVLGTDGVALGVAPHVQLGTNPLLDVVGIPTGFVRVAPLETAPAAVAIDVAYGSSVLGALEATLVEAGPSASVHAGRVDLHAAADYLLVAASATGWDPVGTVAMRAERLIAHGAVEVVATKSGAVIATAGAVPWGRSSGETSTSFAPLDVLTAGPVGAVGAEETWWGTLGWKHTSGPVSVRAALGVSAEPWVWLRDAFSLQVRFGPPARPAAADVAAEDVEQDGAAASE